MSCIWYGYDVAFCPCFVKYVAGVMLPVYLHGVNAIVSNLRQLESTSALQILLVVKVFSLQICRGAI